jgi:hypothetical protein
MAFLDIFNLNKMTFLLAMIMVLRNVYNLPFLISFKVQPMLNILNFVYNIKKMIENWHSKAIALNKLYFEDLFILKNAKFQTKFEQYSYSNKSNSNLFSISLRASATQMEFLTVSLAVIAIKDIFLRNFSSTLFFFGCQINIPRNSWSAEPPTEYNICNSKPTQLHQSYATMSKAELPNWGNFRPMGDCFRWTVFV